MQGAGGLPGTPGWEVGASGSHGAADRSPMPAVAARMPLTCLWAHRLDCGGARPQARRQGWLACLCLPKACAPCLAGAPGAHPPPVFLIPSGDDPGPHGRDDGKSHLLRLPGSDL